MTVRRVLRSRDGWLWPVGILLSVVIVAAGLALDVDRPLRPLISVWFLTVCPGAAWVRLMGVDDAAVRWTIAIAASVSLELLIALGMVYTGWWSIGWAFGIVAAVTVAGAVMDLLRVRRRIPQEGRS